MNQFNSIYRRFDYLCGGILLLTVAFCYMLMQICWLLDIYSVHFALPVAFVAAVLCMCYPVEKRQIKLSVLAVFMAFVILLALMFLTALWTDSSFDGICYHQEQVALIYGGWNPSLRQLEPQVSNVWVNHYPIGMESVGAAIMGVTGHLQSAKAIIPIMAIMTYFLSRGLLAQVIPGVKPNIRTWIAVLIACNPVIVAQLLSSYVDGTIAEYIAMTILMAIAIVVRGRNDWHNYLLLAAIIVLSVATKFSSLVLELVTAALLFLGFWIFGYLKQCGRFFIISVLFGTVGVFLFSYYPYVVNWQTAGNPLYPLAGDGAIDIISAATADTFGEGSSRFANFFRSIYAWRIKSGVAPAVGGFSITFAVLFPISVAIIIIDAVRCKKFTPELYSMVCMVASCFIFEACWWARYIPYLWLLVPLSFYTINRDGIVFKLRKLLSVTISILSLLGASSVLIYTAFITFRYTSHRNAVYAVLRGKTVPMTGAYVQLQRLMEEHEINVVPLSFYDKPSQVLRRGISGVASKYTLDCYGEPIFYDWPFMYVWLTPEQKAEFESELTTTAFYRLYHAVRPDQTVIRDYHEPIPALRHIESLRIPTPD